jgi:hypothetical protein
MFFEYFLIDELLNTVSTVFLLYDYYHVQVSFSLVPSFISNTGSCQANAMKHVYQNHSVFLPCSSYLLDV